MCSLRKLTSSLFIFFRKRIFERRTEPEYEPMPEADRPGGFDFGQPRDQQEQQHQEEEEQQEEEDHPHND